MLFPLSLCSLCTRLCTLAFHSRCQVIVTRLVQLVFQLLLKSALCIVSAYTLFCICLSLFNHALPEGGRTDVFERVLFNKLLELLGIALLGLVQEVVHVEQEWEADSLVELLPLPGSVVEGEALQLQGQDLRQTI